MRSNVFLRQIAGMLFLMGMVVVTSPAATADGPCSDQRVYYKSVTVYETVRQPREYRVVRYDHCGTPSVTTVTVWKSVRVPVTRRVAVHY